MRSLSAADISCLAGITERAARKILARGHYRGHQLDVRQVAGRGGKGGRRYEAALDSLPADWQARWCELGGDGAGDAAADDEPTPGQLKVPLFRFSEDEQRLALEKFAASGPIAHAGRKTREAGELVRQFNKRFGLKHEGRTRALARLAHGYEDRDGVWQPGIGHVAFLKKVRRDAGKPRAKINRRLDEALRHHGHAEDVVDSLAARFARVAGGIMQKTAASFFNVRELVPAALLYDLKALLPYLDEAAILDLCKPSLTLVKSRRNHRKVREKRFDAETHSAKNITRIKRDRSDLAYNELWAVDVQVSDVPLKLPNGRIVWPRHVCFIEVRTNYMFGMPFIFPANTGLRTEHVAEALEEAFATIGVPNAIITDHGSEFLFLDREVQKLMAAVNARMGTSCRIGPLSNIILRPPPYEPQPKYIEAHINALHRTAAALFSEWQGGNRLQPKAARKGKERNAVRGDDESYTTQWFTTVGFYNTKPQQSGWIAGRSAHDVREQLKASVPVVKVPPQLFRMDAAKTESRVVAAGGKIIVKDRGVATEYVTMPHPKRATEDIRLYEGRRVYFRVPYHSPDRTVFVFKDARCQEFICYARPLDPFMSKDADGARVKAQMKAEGNRAFNALAAEADNIEPIELAARYVAVKTAATAAESNVVDFVADPKLAAIAMGADALPPAPAPSRQPTRTAESEKEAGTLRDIARGAAMRRRRNTQ